MQLWHPDEDPSVDLTPMIDIVFLLIAFFMILASVVSDELIDIKVPLAEEAKVPEEKGERQFVTLKNDGSLFFGSRQVTSAQLQNLLANERESRPDMRVYLRADSNVSHRYVNEVMNACAQAGILNIIFATNRS